MENKKIVPVYELVEDKDLEPVRRKIKKTMEITEEFTMYDVLQYVAKIDKTIADKETEIEALKVTKQAYLDELVHVESQTSVNSLQEEFAKNVAENIGDSVESPYVEVKKDEEKND